MIIGPTISTQNDGYWDLRENIHIFAHPTLESLTLRRARLDYRGFDLMEQPHATALKKLHLVECDINDDALSDLLVFPEALQEFVMTQLEDPQPELEESSDMFRDYMVAIDSAAASLETVTIDFPSLAGHKPLALREFEKLTTLRMNWDYQLFGKTSRKPRLQSVGLPPSLETLEFFGELGRDEEVTELLAHMIEHLDLHAAKLERIVVGEGTVPPEVKAACLKHPRLKLDVIGEFDVSDDEGEEQSEKEEQESEKSRESLDDDEKPDEKPVASHEEWPKLEHDGIFKDNLHSATHQVVDMEVDNRTDSRV
ncbi:hypothetical protein BN1708_015411, partial [Verticillium longisporum]